MTTKTVAVTQYVDVTVDESKFTEEFMADFRSSFYPFMSVDDHIKHLAQLAARGIYDLSKFSPEEFIEGYGPAGEMGLAVDIKDQEVEIQ